MFSQKYRDLKVSIYLSLFIFKPDFVVEKKVSKYGFPKVNMHIWKETSEMSQFN